MCTVSFVGDHYQQQWQPQYWPYPVAPISREEFDALRAEVEEMKELLRAAKRIDEVTGQPDCETDAKMEILRKVAELVDVDLSDVIGPAK